MKYTWAVNLFRELVCLSTHCHSGSKGDLCHQGDVSFLASAEFPKDSKPHILRVSLMNRVTVSITFRFFAWSQICRGGLRHVKAIVCRPLYKIHINFHTPPPTVTISVFYDVLRVFPKTKSFKYSQFALLATCIIRRRLLNSNNTILLDQFCTEVYTHTGMKFIGSPTQSTKNWFARFHSYIVISSFSTNSWLEWKWTVCTFHSLSTIPLTYQ